MDVNDTILCASSAYNNKYYFNSRFSDIPDAVKKELQIMCVMYTEDVGGQLVVGFSDDGRLMLHVFADEGDLLFDEIGSGLKIKKLQEEKKELFMQLENYYKVFILDKE